MTLLRQGWLPAALLLAACGTRAPAPLLPAAPRFAEPVAGARAHLSFFVPATPARRWSAWIYRDAAHCRDPGAVATDEARATDRAVAVPAGAPLTFRLVVQQGTGRAARRCDLTTTFTPEPDRHYVAELRPDVARCTLQLTDFMYQGRGLPAGALPVSYQRRAPDPAGACPAAASADAASAQLPRSP